MVPTWFFNFALCLSCKWISLYHLSGIHKCIFIRLLLWLNRRRGKCLHIVILLLLLFPCSLMVSTKLLWYDCTQLDKVEKQQNQIEKRSQSSRSSTIWEAWLKELSHKSFSRSKESIIKKRTLVAQITKWIYNNNLLKMYKVERMEFWISKNIFNNALEMMKSYKNECLVK